MSGVRGDSTEIIRRPVKVVTGAVVLGLLDVFLVAALAVVNTLSGGIFFGLLLVLAVVATVRMARSGVVVDPSGLTVRGTFRTHRIPWDQVLYIAPATDDMAHSAISVMTRDGTRVRCHGLAAMRIDLVRWGPSFRDGPPFRQLYARLNQHLEIARADGRCPALD